MWEKRTPSQNTRKTHHKPINYKLVGDMVIASPPDCCSLFSNDEHMAFIEFIDTLKSQAVKHPKILIDFNECSDVKACCLVILYSAIQQCRDINSNIIIIIQDFGAPRSVRDNIIKCGLKSACSASQEEVSFRTVKTLPIQTNFTAEVDDIVDYVQYSVFKGTLNEQQENTLSNAVEEAIINVSHHAFESSEDSRWWVITELIGENQLYLAIYDNGVGIPKRAPKTKWIVDAVKEQGISFFFEGASDEKLINLSMGLSRSRTGHSERGLGSISIKELVKSNPHGQLYIFSGKGMYNLNSASKVTLEKYTRSMPGTLVQWNIQI